MYATPTSLVRSADKIGSPPEVFVRLNAALNRGNYSMDELADYVSADAGLTVRLLCVANSSYFGFRRKIVNVSEAIGAIGVNHLRELVTTTAVISKFGNISSDLMSIDAFWRHSVAVGLGTRILATLRKEAGPENFFIAGVLHDVGRLVMLLRMPEQYRRVMERCRQSGELLHLVEREVFQYDHAEVGEALLRQWNLPVMLAEGVGAHHAPQKAERHPMFAALVHLADVLAHGMELGGSGERFVPKVSYVAWAQLGQPVSVLPGVMDALATQYGQMVNRILKGTER